MTYVSYTVIISSAGVSERKIYKKSFTTKNGKNCGIESTGSETRSESPKIKNMQTNVMCLGKMLILLKF